MGKLDWYILKKLLVTFFFCMMLFTVVAVAVDSSEKADDFVKSGLSSTEIITRYYFGFVPHIWGLLFPLFVFIAVIFFTSKMAVRSEIIAILASGTSFNRMLRPYILGGTFLAFMLWLGNRYLIPRANEIRSNFQSNYVDPNSGFRQTGEFGCYQCFYQRVDSNTYIGIKNFDTASKTAGKFFMEKMQGDRVIYNLRSNSLRWEADKEQWMLLRAVERFVDSMGERTAVHDTFRFKMALRPDELIKDDYLKDKLTTPELKEFIAREELRGREGLSALRVEQYRRTATPAAVLLLTLIGAVIASRKTRGGSGMHLALGIIIAALFILSDRFSTVFATKGNLPPLLAAWIPNLVFTLVAWRLYRKAPK
jgi:lipopolysaccharide export system permease protein